ncbi:MAG TPA: radical SAM protein [Rhizomicrobium sp.]|nr:radical SAM protein [Rhizomicrobium sp.]
MDRQTTHSASGDPRLVLRRIRELLDENPHLAPRYEEAKRIIRIFRKPAFYEITQRCNLKCEGCYYFEGGFKPVPEQDSIAAWEAFFAAEAERGVSIAYFVGAEPALEQERLVAASKTFPYGNVGTNGTVKIDPVVPYRISISMWAGDDDTDRKLRGASVFKKAFKNYQGDPRVLVYFTLSRWNLGTVRTVVEMCKDNGFPLTFNLYSPSITFLQKLNGGAANDRDFFRVSKQGDTPMFTDADLAEARKVVRGLMDEFPETVLYSKAYNEWSTRSGPMHEIDENGLAPRCGSRILGHMNYYGSDLKQQHPKCCTPDLDCSQCRIMSGGWSTKLQPDAHDLSSGEGFSNWLDILEALNRIFVFENKNRSAALAGASQADAVAAQ